MAPAPYRRLCRLWLPLAFALMAGCTSKSAVVFTPSEAATPTPSQPLSSLSPSQLATLPGNVTASVKPPLGGGTSSQAGASNGAGGTAGAGSSSTSQGTAPAGGGGTVTPTGADDTTTASNLQTQADAAADPLASTTNSLDTQSNLSDTLSQDSGTAPAEASDGGGSTDINGASQVTTSGLQTTSVQPRRARHHRRR